MNHLLPDATHYNNFRQNSGTQLLTNLPIDDKLGLFIISMLMKKIPLARFETLARRLFEGSFARLVGPGLRLHDIAIAMAHAWEDSQKQGSAATDFAIQLHPTAHQLLLTQHPDAATLLQQYVTDLFTAGGQVAPSTPQITLQANSTTRADEIVVKTMPSPDEPDITQALSRDDEGTTLSALADLAAFLIHNGKVHIPLDRASVTIGRDTNNDIVLDSKTVSRRHAQIRWRYGHFILADLNSLGGTHVNGERITQYVLHPGDVIRISQESLIYGEEEFSKQLPKQAATSSDAEDTTLNLPRNRS